jgi:hypothetical protein
MITVDVYQHQLETKAETAFVVVVESKPKNN